MKNLKAVKNYSLILFSLLLVVVLAVPALAATPITRSEAVAIAKEQVPGGQLISIDYDRDDGATIYEMEWIGSDNYEYDVDVSTAGTVVKFKRDDYKMNAESYRNPGITHEKAVTIAENKMTNFSFDEVKLQVTGSGIFYKVTLYNPQGRKHQAVLNAADGSVVASTKNYLAAANSSATDTVTATNITLEDAKTIALDYAGGGTITKAKSGWDDGRLEYEIEIHSAGLEYEFDIDAATGRILKVEIDD